MYETRSTYDRQECVFDAMPHVVRFGTAAVAVTHGAFSLPQSQPPPLSQR